jgi:GNAT superfamily N-acetyltransferase
MITIRPYRDADAPAAGRLIADTYREFNLGFADPDLQARMLGPFRHARSPDPAHREAIARVLRAPTGLVAEADGELAGILRGRAERLASLFVAKPYHRLGIGRRLVARFEAISHQHGVEVIRVAATLYAVPFYQAQGYRRSTGVRLSWSFEGHGLPVQPMRKILK